MFAEEASRGCSPRCTSRVCVSGAGVGSGDQAGIGAYGRSHALGGGGGPGRFVPSIHVPMHKSRGTVAEVKVSKLKNCFKKCNLTSCDSIRTKI